MSKTSKKELMKKACLLCDKSKCGYKTGCIVVEEGKVLIEGWNETLPGEDYCQDGACYRETHQLKGGKDIEKVCSIHAEANVIAKAAQQGISLQGKDMYVTTFPCLICARLISKTGISRLYFMSDYMGSNQGRKLLEASKIKVSQIIEAEVWEK